MSSSKDNQFLLVAPQVTLTPIIEPVIIALDKYFAAANLHAVVTSGLRDAYKQLEVIRQYMRAKGVDKTYPLAMTCKPTDMANGNYVWQMAWSRLLNMGVIINPPLQAVCLLDSLRPNGTNRKGTPISQTPHARGTAFNIGGIAAVNVLNQALKEKLPGFASYLVERENNATHCDCYQVKI
jgi:hypothetical protein